METWTSGITWKKIIREAAETMGEEKASPSVTQRNGKATGHGASRSLLDNRCAGEHGTFRRSPVTGRRVTPRTTLLGPSEAARAGGPEQPSADHEQ